MKKGFLIAFATVLTLSIKAQNKDYFQQEVNYKISVELNDKKHELHAFEEIEYVNNSADELNFLYFHLWPNAFKNKETAFAKQKRANGSSRFHFAKDETLGYIDSLDFKANGKNVKWEYDQEDIDICKIVLNEPLLPGAKIKITTPFKVKLPDSYSRLGHVDQQYQITQWYPKPAVYDVNGWHAMPYLDQGEFYSEFGKFDVSITLPKNYVVGATGNLQNKEEHEFLIEKAKETAVIEQYDLDDPFPTSLKEMKTLRYIQDNVHDFAWFADKRYHVKTGEVVLPHSGRKVKLTALYNNRDAYAWENIIEYMHDGVYNYSKWIGDYPYDVVTVVDGALSAGSGMEYPTITVLGASNPFFLEIVTVHEIGHNWFYGILGSNERDHAWMDEGFNSFYEMRYITEKYPEASVAGTNQGGLSKKFQKDMTEYLEVNKHKYKEQYELGYQVKARVNKDQPIDITSNDIESMNYGMMVYMKTAYALNYLRNYLGTEEFDRIMQKYYTDWQFKHPQPGTVKVLFETESGKDLGWFFNDLIATSKKVDYKLVNVSDGEVNLKNKGKVDSPVQISTFKDEEVVEQKWIEGFEGKQSVKFNNLDFDKVVIDDNQIMTDLYRNNNQLKAKGLLKKVEPLQLKLLGALDNPKKSQLYFMPTVGGNTNDHFLVGAAFYNSILPQKKFDFMIMPMYSFGLEKLSGSVELNYRIYPRNAFREITLSGMASSFAGFDKITPRIDFIFRPKSMKSSATQRLSLTYSYINVDTLELPVYKDDYAVTTLSYSIENGDAIMRYSGGLKVENIIDNMTNLSGEFDLRYQYLPKNFINARVYYGTIISGNNIHNSFLLNMSGSTDYTMDNVLFDRAQKTDHAAAFVYQANLTQGGFRSYLPVSSSKWLAALNFNVDIPKLKMFALYGDVGFAGGTSGAVYGMGLKIRVVRDIVEVYAPLLGDSFTNNSPENWKDFQRQLRFTVNLKALHPIKFINNQL